MSKWKRVASMWHDTNRGQFSVIINETVEAGTKLYVFSNDKPKSDKSPQYSLCVKLNEDLLDPPQQEQPKLDDFPL